MSKVAGSPTPGRSYPWAVVGMLWSVCFFNYADRQSIFAVFPVLEHEFHFTKYDLGLIASVFMWLYAFAAPFAGYIGDRFRRKTLILGGCVFWSSVTAMTGLCRSLPSFVTVRALAGMGETFYFPASMSMLSDYHGPATRSRALSLHQSGVYAGTIAGSFLGALFAETIGWRAGFYVFGAAGALLSLMLFRFLREPLRETADTAASASEPAPKLLEAIVMVFKKPIGWLLMLAFAGANFVGAIFLSWTPSFLHDKFGFSLTKAALLGPAAIHLPSIIGVPVAGWLADRLAKRLRGGRAIVQAIGLIAGASFVYLVGSTTSGSTILVAMMGFGVCKSFYDSGIFASLYDVVPVRARGTAAGVMNTVGWGGGALGPVAVGWLTMHGASGTQMGNMSHAIALSSSVYVFSAAVLIAAAIFLERV
ncbi:MAG: MFS transporter [Capsulimonadaceae bacterium]|nr:MFS transporter [Capsulimonadaceae bacterium]